jgi:glycosyltransferase involved in cell wall biosynthesis
VVPSRGLYAPGDAAALASRLQELWRNPEAGERGLAVVRERFSPAAIAAALRSVYERP